MLGLTHHDSLGRLYLIEPSSSRGAGDAGLDRETARGVVREWADRAPIAELRQLLDASTGVPPSAWATRGDLVRELVERVGWDLVVHAVSFPAVVLPPREQEEDEEEAAAREEPSERHDLRFAFEYPDRSPAAQWPYRFTDLDGNRSTGELPDNGMIEESNVRQGTYQVELKEVVSAVWLERKVDCGAEVGLVARVSGFDDGAPAKVRIFRRFAELDRQVVDTLDASVADGAVECTYRFDYAASERRAAQDGQVELVAEVSLEGGKVWSKTIEPLTVQLKTLRSVRWSPARIGPGVDTELVARTLGYPDGAEVAFHVFLQDPLQGPRELTAMNVPMAGGEARTRLLFAPSTESSDPELDGERIQRAGEYFVRVVIEDDVRREGRSDVLSCDPLAAAG